MLPLSLLDLKLPNGEYPFAYTLTFENENGNVIDIHMGRDDIVKSRSQEQLQRYFEMEVNYAAT